ncbi:hypothetical protein RFI_14315 [Reticulomyxa filosa]|uniref:Uncharacterized protein n=1 Tax=Reticulomyxa filosa TaxID=46433 RepID=X6N9C9_RETFI|nr:hypothetical protein RFI_14315 [Reticulomyxa filosa]|eukprot:ETO22875.1 hypothetical protein RFI_14315 [Reticulomyxa filosa]
MCANNKSSENKNDLHNSTGKGNLELHHKLSGNDEPDVRKEKITTNDKRNNEQSIEYINEDMRVLAVGQNEEKGAEDADMEIQKNISMDKESQDDNEGLDYKEFERKWNKYMEDDEFEKCETLCFEMIKKKPSNSIRSQMHNRLGYLYERYLGNKQFDDILEHYVLALQFDDHCTDAHFNLANFLFEQGSRHLSLANELNPNHPLIKQRIKELQLATIPHDVVFCCFFL